MGKRYRIYFNRKEDFPAVWSIDEGDTSSEIRVQRIQLNGVSGFGGCSLGPPPPYLVGVIQFSGAQVEKSKNEPGAWIEFYGAMTIEDGMATFTGVSE